MALNIMSFKHIVSRDNPIFKYQKKLADNARERRAEGKTLLDGVHLIESYCAAFGDPELIIAIPAACEHDYVPDANVC